MIRSEAEYRRSVEKLREHKSRIRKQREQLKKEGLDAGAIKRVLDPTRFFAKQMEAEVESYERLKRGDLGELHNLHGLGQILIALRIALGMSQRELAERLGVNESLVSRDERNEYHGVTVDRVSRILDALGVDLKSSFEKPVLAPKVA